MIATAASAIYAAAAGWRRRWYARHPARRHRLARPVISVGNLRVGGSGKTPTVGHLARLLVEQGQRPAILSRGYGRRRTGDEGVTIVSDGTRVLASLELAGDEPLMLARALPGVAVIVGPSRYRSGRVAEERLGATVHLLDDGFQHVALERDVDLLLVSEDDLADRPLPAGRLRERLSAAAAADAVLTTATGQGQERIRTTLGVETVFTVRRCVGPLRWLSDARPVTLSPEGSVVAVAGIARPERFVADLGALGCHVAAQLLFPDHHRFLPADISRIRRTLQTTGAAAVVTTEKDAVRLTALDVGDLQIATLPLEVTIEPAELFGRWLGARLRR